MKAFRRFPEVLNVVTRTGSPEIATDVMGGELSDVFVVLKPSSEWTSAANRDELIAKMKAAVLETVPGIGWACTADRNAIQRTDRGHAIRCGR